MLIGISDVVPDIHTLALLQGFTSPEALNKVERRDGKPVPLPYPNFVKQLLTFLSGGGVEDPFHAVLAYRNFKPETADGA